MGTKNEIAVEITEQEFKDIINNSHKLVIVDFFAEWCMPCVMQTPIIEELAEKFNDVKFVQLNVDDNQKLSARYSVSSIPCLIFFKNGKEVDRVIGLRDADFLEERINEHLK